MSESSGKYKLAVASHNQMRRDSNQMLRDIHKSLRHLNFREVAAANHQQCQDVGGNDLCQQQQQQQQQQQHHLQQQQQQQQQQQLTFEQQLALEGNINALTQSAAGERRSYPRATKQTALEEIRIDLKPFQWRNETSLGSSGYLSDYTKVDGSHQNFKSNSFTDLSRVDMEVLNTPHSQQQALVSCGYDEAIAAESLHDPGGVNPETYVDILHPHKRIPNNSSSKVTQNPRLFSIPPHTTRSASSVFNPQANSHTSQMTSNQYSSNAFYYTKHGAHETPHRAVYQTNHGVYDQPAATRQYSGAERTNFMNCESHFNQLSQGSNTYNNESRPSPIYSNPSEMHGLDPTSPRKMSAESHNWNTKKHVVEQPHYEDVTLRQKSTDRQIPAQNRWSAEVYAIPYDLKPPPPYPGYVKGSQRPTGGPDTELVQVGTNTPITVIFDEKNDRVNVVGGIPEGYEKITSSSSGQSSPRQSQQKDPPLYIFTSSSPQPPYIQPQYIQSPNSSQVHPSPAQQSSQIFSQPLDITFVPIKEPPRRERGSPPPYPGRPTQLGSNRNSINLDELENSAGRELQMPQYYSSDSGNSSKRTSTATEPGSFNQSDSSASASPTPDGVERSYSPLPLCHSCSSDTAITNSFEKIEVVSEEKKEKVEEERYPTRLKNCNPQAYKFFMEQHVENLIKLHEQRKHRRTQLEAEMLRVGLAEQAQEEMRKLLNKKESNYNRLRRAKMDISMFTKIITVGAGAFGEVNLVRKNGTNAYYAMKILRKSEVLRRNQVAHVKAERDILAEADNEWVVKLYYSFQNEHNLYFVMEYVAGGDLMALLIKVGIFEEELARFYISELTLAIESVHKLGFIHRDIKPDNVLIDCNGHIKLTDFGLCTGFHWTHDSKYYQPQSEGEGHSRQFSMEPEGGWESLLNDVNCDCQQIKLQNDLCKPLKRRQLRRHIRCQAHSLVGTPNYTAPEVLMRVPYSQQCDWWSVGVILYEMLIGQPPFLAPTPAETQIKVLNWCQTLSIPKKQLPKESRDLIRKLCTFPEERLGKEGAEEIKVHRYFKGVDFKEIHHQQAPYIPTIKHATDTSNFDPVPEHMSGSLLSEENMPIEDNNKIGGPEYAFYEFTFRHFFDDGGIANPNFELPDQEKPKPLSHAKRPNTNSNKSIDISAKVSALSSSVEGDEKVPIYV